MSRFLIARLQNLQNFIVSQAIMSLRAFLPRNPLKIHKTYRVIYHSQLIVGATERLPAEQRDQRAKKFDRFHLRLRIQQNRIIRK